MQPFLNIQPSKKYRTIMVDPPWPKVQKANSYNGKGLDYPTLTIAEICSLPVQELADRDCKLFLWTTNRFLPEAMAMIRLWRFEYSMLYTWTKSYGMGRSPLVATEHCIIATVGQPPTPQFPGKAVLNHMRCPKPKRHSEKPAKIIKVFERLGQTPRIELFARQSRKGWDGWGDEYPTT